MYIIIQVNCTNLDPDPTGWDQKVGLVSHQWQFYTEIGKMLF